MYRECQKKVFITIARILIIFSPISFLDFFMPVMYRGYRRNYRRSRWPYRSMRSGLVRAQTSGTRRMNLSIPVQEAFSINITTPVGGAGNFWSSVYCVQPYFAVTASTNMDNVAHGCLINSRLYRVYTTLYDEVKINSVYVKMTVMTNIGSGGVTPALRVLTMWDRSIDAEDIIGTNLPSHTNMETGSGSQSSMIVNNSRAILSRYVKASDIQECSKFHDCSIVSDGSYMYDGTWVTRKLGSESIRNGQDCGFVPGMFFALNSATAPAAGSSFTFSVQLDVKYNVTFRNPKFGLSAYNAKGIGVEDPGETKSEIAVKKTGDETGMEEEPILKKKKVVYEEEVLPDDDTLIDDESEESQREPTKEELLAEIARLKGETK